MFQQIAGQHRQQDLEARVLARWKACDVFLRAQSRRKDAPRFTFYEGPPTANGKPGIHHVLARTLKDVVCRYRDLAGYLVERKGGWDTHGLPVEVEVEKSLGIHGKDAIRAYGVEQFTRRCIDSVFTYTEEWERLTDRIGFWLDLPNAYVTYHESYVESVWWSLKELYDRGFLYQGHKVVWWWPQGGTALSSGEVGLGYRETQDPSVTVRFRLKDSLGLSKPVSCLAWTTTPWTLPSNVALAVGSDIEYTVTDLGDEALIVATDLLEKVFKDKDPTVLRTLRGHQLVGLSYEPLFSFAEPRGGRGHEIVADDFVTTDSGTGIVHLAPGFGEDDTRVCQQQGLGFLQLVDPNGNMSPETGEFAGIYLKDADKPIIRNLKERGLLFAQATYLHDYPFCWRAAADPLIQYARESWFIRTTAKKDRLLAENAAVNWYPPHIKEGRFGDFLRNNVDWALSRERFWGTPLPIWINDETGTIECVGSVAEILERNPEAFVPFERAKAADPSLSPHLRVHKPWVDDVTWTKPGEPGTYRRVPEVIDCWYDSGAMPFAQRHYPFENADLFAASHPADFICEGLDQTRGWFYGLLAISTLLFDKAPYRNVMVNGLVNDKEGRKMSKSLGNTVNPWSVIDATGADPLRWYLLASSPPWSAKSFDEEGVTEVARRVFGTLWPSFNFFALYADVDQWTPKEGAPPPKVRGPMDRWLLSRTNTLLGEYREAMEAFDPQRAVRLLGTFIVDELSNWYIRRSRARFWKSKDRDDKNAAYDTLHRALSTVASLLAPIAPLSADALYWGLNPHLPEDHSIHLTDLPRPDPALRDASLEKRMAAVLEVVSLGRAARDAASLKVRQPLARLVASGPDREALEGLKEPSLAKEVKDELNVKELLVAERSGIYCTVTLKPNLPVLGPRLGRHLGTVRTQLQSLDADALERFERDGFLELSVGGEAIRLQGDDLLVERTGKEGYAVAADRGYMAALETTLTEPLLREGLAREVINRVQNQRKQAGLEVTTRIKLHVVGPDDIVAAVEEFKEHVGQEVLALDVSTTTATKAPAGDAKEWEIDGKPFWMIVEAQGG